ncbi:MAG TPA: metallopeptidase TldD-related protein [Thermoanaerobaculia bacterium]|nr:metallopeptidase TldD-related protein [Thermoanaerobaculia bacterium]
MKATRAEEHAEAVLAALQRAGLPEAEVYLKEGRSRRLALGLAGAEHQVLVEEGWGVRAGDRRSAFFAAGTGRPEPAGPWPAPQGFPSPLPDPSPVVRWSDPPDLDSPLLTELEAQALLNAVAEALAAELPGATLVEATLEDGSSASTLASSHGIRARWRHRVAWARLVAALPESAPAGAMLGAPVRATVEQGAREARRLQPKALARALADRLAVRARGSLPERESGDVVLAPAVAARLVAALLPLLVGPEARERAAPLVDRAGRIGSPQLSVVDDGRLPNGLLATAVDGEGVPTRAVPLIEGGLYRQPLLAWWQARGGSSTTTGTPAAAPAASARVASGCSARPSFRDLPRPGPTHLFVRPQGGVRPAMLVGDIARGCYLLDVDGPGHFDLAAGRFALPVCGFQLDAGAARRPLAGGWLCGSIGALLRGVAGVARDLAFFPLAGMIGSPTLRITGLEVRAGE